MSNCGVADASKRAVDKLRNETDLSKQGSDLQQI